MENESTQNNTPTNLNTLSLKFSNISTLKPSIFVDGKKINYKKDNFGNKIATYKTEKSTIDIQVKKLFDINGPLWILSSLLFFFLSIFGIFDIRPDKKCLSVVASIKVKITQNSKLKMVFKSRSQVEKAFELEAEDCEILEETGNNYFVDETAKKRYKIMRIVKISIWIALIAIVAIIVLKYSGAI